MSSQTEARLQREYVAAMREAKAAEQALTAALDRLVDARQNGTPADITPARVRAEQAERQCETAVEAVERARCAYWLELAKRAEADLVECALPLVAAIEHCSRAGGSQLGTNGYMAALRLAQLPRPPYAGTAGLPHMPTESAALDRADDEI